MKKVSAFMLALMVTLSGCFLMPPDGKMVKCVGMDNMKGMKMKDGMKYKYMTAKQCMKHGGKVMP